MTQRLIKDMGNILPSFSEEINLSIPEVGTQNALFQDKRSFYEK